MIQKFSSGFISPIADVLSWGRRVFLELAPHISKGWASDPDFSTASKIVCDYRTPLLGHSSPGFDWIFPPCSPPMSFIFIVQK